MILQLSYLVGFFDNLMVGGEDVENMTMVVEMKAEWGRGKMTDRQEVSAGTGIWGSDNIQTGSTKWETQ